MFKFKQRVLIFSLGVALASTPMLGSAAEVKQGAISTVNPQTLIPVGTENAIYPDQPYEEYGTEGKPLREPIPFAEHQCTSNACHYPTNRWFTDLLFYAKNRGGVGENFAVGQYPYDLSVFDDSTTGTVEGHPFFLMLPGLYVRFNLPIVTVSGVEKPYQYNINGDMYYPYLSDNPTSHFMLTVPYTNGGTKPETTRKITYYDALTLTTEWTLANGGGSMTAPIVRGSPYVTMEYKALPVTLRTYQNSGFFAIASDQEPAKILTEGMRVTGKIFRFMLTVDDFSYGDKQKVPYPPRYFEYMLFASAPITLEFLQRPVSDPSYVLQTVNAGTGAPEKFTGVIRVAYAGAATPGSTDLSQVRAIGFKALENHAFSSTEKMLTDYANVYPTGVDLKLDSDNKAGSVTFDWKTKHMDNTPSHANNDPLLMMAFEKNQVPYLSNVTKGDPSYRLTTLRGTMVPVIGSQWTLNVPYSPELYDANLWYGSKRVPEQLKPELQEALNDDIAWLQKPLGYGYPNLAIGARNDSYAFGKQVARIARLALIADELGDTKNRDIALSKVKEALSLWFPRTEPKDKIGLRQSYMRYDNKFGGIVTARAASDPNNCQYDGVHQDKQCGYNLDFYNGQYTDHHFHYGYFLYAAAVLGKYDAAWLGQYKEAINLLARDIANPSELDTYFPQYRYFDWFEGHAYANGLVPGGDGRNQESTSEGINAWYGLTLWGNVTGNNDLANTGRLMTMLEARAAQDWTQITPGPGKSIYDAFEAKAGSELNPKGPDIKMSDLIVSGINWALKVDHTTFFGLIKSYLIGIQLIPFTPVSHALIGNEWIQGKTQANKYAIKDAVDSLITKIKYYQIATNAQDSIFSKFLSEWKERHSGNPNDEYLSSLEGKLNAAYQWGLNSMPAFALADANETYRYTAFNTNGLFFTEMQKANDAFYQEALAKNGIVFLRGITTGRACDKVGKDIKFYCYKFNGMQGDIGWPIAKLNYDGIDKGETVTSLLWWDFINKAPDAKPNPPALFWLYDDPKISDLSGTTATVTWEKAKVINGNGTLKYTVQIMGKNACETESNSCQMTQLTPETDYIAVITAADKDGKMMSPITGTAASITKYVNFKTLPASMTSFLHFSGPIVKEKTSDTSVKLTWPPALICSADEPTACKESADIKYEVKSGDYQQTLCSLSNDTACELRGLDPNISYNIWVLAITTNAETKSLPFTFKINEAPIVVEIEWSRNIQVITDDKAASAQISWDAATQPARVEYAATLDGKEIYKGPTPQTLSFDKLSYGDHLVSVAVSDPANPAAAAVIASQHFTLNEMPLKWTGAVNASGTTSKVTVTWEKATTGKSSDDDHIAYKVEIIVPSTGAEGTLCNLIGTTTCIFSWSDPQHRPPEGTYGIRVSASFAGLPSPPPLLTNVTLAPDAGPALTWTGSIHASGNTSKITVNWDKATTGKPDEDDRIAYKVEIIVPSTGAEGTLCNLIGTTTCTFSWPDQQQPPEGTYGLRVEAAFNGLPSPAPMTSSIDLQKAR